MPDPTYDQIEQAGRMIEECARHSPLRTFSGFPIADEQYLVILVYLDDTSDHVRLAPDGQRLMDIDELERRVRRCTEAVVQDDVGLGEALRRHFPMAKTGDEDPLEHVRLSEALEAYVRAWATNNVRALER